MDIGKAFTFPFDDQEWVKKLIIGAVLLIIPVVNFIAIGYMIRVMRNVAEGDTRPLPEWDQWGDDFMKGLLVALAGLAYALPILLVNGISAIFGIIASSANSDGVQSVMALCSTALSCLSGLWGLLIAVVIPAAILKYAQEGEFSSFFKFAEIFQWIRDHAKDYIIAVLVIIVARILSGFGVIACGIGVLFTMFWATLTMGHILGQLWAATNPPPAAAAATSYGDYTPPSPTISDEGEEV
ncbi:MAG TPA: DUF4013 domain-containing protein [Chloroflexi bacterium]|jgi:hypothetical protein|nr:DUF4013 domain-containing protein [Chloroflexota bacterium]